jgi:hypothetical protein
MSSTTPVDRSYRATVTWIAAACAVALAAVVVVLAIGGRPDPPAVRAVAPLLDGPWRFSVGDDPRWAAADLDDGNWEVLDLTAPASSNDGDVGLPNYTAGWMGHGHRGYRGYAWYRRAVSVPPGDRAWDVLGPPAVDHAYEIFWNGARLGGSGRLGDSPRVVATRPMIFALPADVAGTRGVLAIRVFMDPGYGATDDNSGGIHIAPTLAPRPESRALYRAQWWRTTAGYVVEVVEPLAMFALIGWALAIRGRSSHLRFIASTCIALVPSALKRLDNAIVSWTDLMSLPVYLWLIQVVWMPVSLAAWALAWNRWTARPSRIIDGAALLLGAVGVAGGALHAAALGSIHRLGLLALFGWIGVRIVRGAALRGLALATLGAILVAQYADELSAIGVPGIWFPFGIGVSRTQYAYAVAIPLLALLIARTVHFRSAHTPEADDAASRTMPAVRAAAR